MKANLSKYYISHDEGADKLERGLSPYNIVCLAKALANRGPHLSSLSPKSPVIHPHNEVIGVPGQDTDSPSNWQGTNSQRPESPGHKVSGKFARTLAVFFVPSHSMPAVMVAPCAALDCWDRSHSPQSAKGSRWLSISMDHQSLVTAARHSLSQGGTWSPSRLLTVRNS